jgi:hypothetical protein
MTTPATTPPPEGQERPQDGQESQQTAPIAQSDRTAPETAPEGQDGDRDTFPSAVVKDLRDENAKLRVRSKRSDELATRLVHAIAGQDGRLADPTDLPVSDDLLDDDGLPDTAKVQHAIEELLKKKPHLASTRPKVSDIGQGARPGASDVSLADILRAGA